MSSSNNNSIQELLNFEKLDTLKHIFNKNSFINIVKSTLMKYENNEYKQNIVQEINSYIEDGKLIIYRIHTNSIVLKYTTKVLEKIIIDRENKTYMSFILNPYQEKCIIKAGNDGSVIYEQFYNVNFLYKLMKKTYFEKGIKIVEENSYKL